MVIGLTEATLLAPGALGETEAQSINQDLGDEINPWAHKHNTSSRLFLP